MYLCASLLLTLLLCFSQRDPGEYLVDLQRFADIKNHHLRYATIDKHLERYSQAVQHLVEAGDDYFDAALKLASEQNLLRFLLSFFKESKSDKRHIVHKALGESLSAKGKYEDAALCFSAGGDLEQALRSYRLAGAWRPALMLAARLGKDQAAIKSLAHRLASDLEDGHNFADAAILTHEYLNDIPRAVGLFARSGDWREGLRIAMASGMHECVDKELAPAAAEAAERILVGLREDVARVKKYWTRLQELRERRLAMEAIKAAADEEARALNLEKDRDYDLETEAASAISGLSIYTDASLAASTVSGTSLASTIGGRKGVPKNQKKHKKNRKKKIRQGSPEEEAQLAGYILSLVPLQSLCTEVGQLSEFLVLIGHEDDAAVLQSALKDAIDEQAKAAQDILKHPPPGEELELTESDRIEIFEKAGAAALIKVDQVIGRLPGPSIQLQVKEAESSMKHVHWKWELLREAEA